MRHERITPPVSEKKRVSLFIVCVVAMLCCSQVALAQSGRRQQRKSTSLPPIPVAAEPPIEPETINPPLVPMVIVGGIIVHDAAYHRSSDVDHAVKDCMERLKERRPSLEVSRGGKMTREEAIARAKKETDAYVLWLEINKKSNIMAPMSLLFIDYYIFTPQTGKVLTEGRVTPDSLEPRIGAVRVPTIHKRSTSRDWLSSGAREVADRVGRKFQVMWPR